MHKFQRFSLALTLLYAFSQIAYTKHLGTVGQVWNIQEQNLLSLINERLNEQFGGKSEQEIQAEISKRITDSAMRPEPTELKRAKENNERTFDPSFTVDRDIADHNGRVFAHKGQVVNPFDITGFNQTLIFIDGDDTEQLEWIKTFKPETEIFKIILIKGNLKEVSELLDEAIYFDQKGSLIQRFNIEKVPSVIDQMPDQKLLRIREFGL